MMSTRNQRGVEQGAGAGSAMSASSNPVHTPAPAESLERSDGTDGGGMVRAGAEQSLHAVGRLGSGPAADASARTTHTSWEAPVARAAWDLERSRAYGVSFQRANGFDRFVFRSWPAFQRTAWAAGEHMLAHPVSAAAFCLGLCAGVVAVGVLLMLPLAWIK